jgi:hypothetical protein
MHRKPVYPKCLFFSFIEMVVCYNIRKTPMAFLENKECSAAKNFLISRSRYPALHSQPFGGFSFGQT